MRNQVLEALDGSEGDFDVEGIVEEIHAEHGLVDIDELPSAYFWGVVAKHDKDAD
jgi:uncharacterized protein with von Willebrand factor type A (vWA) domain